MRVIRGQKALVTGAASELDAQSRWPLHEKVSISTSGM